MNTRQHASRLPMPCHSHFALSGIGLDAGIRNGPLASDDPARCQLRGAGPGAVAQEQRPSPPSRLMIDAGHPSIWLTMEPRQRWLCLILGSDIYPYSASRVACVAANKSPFTSPLHSLCSSRCRSRSILEAGICRHPFAPFSMPFSMQLPFHSRSRYPSASGANVCLVGGQLPGPCRSTEEC